MGVAGHRARRGHPDQRARDARDRAGPARRRRRRPPGGDRVGHQRQDHHHPPARRGAARRPAPPSCRTTPAPTCPPVSPRRSAATATRRSRCSRSTSGGCRRSSTRSGTELLVLGNLTRDQLDRFGEVRSIATRWRDVCATHPDLAVVANASDPHVVWSVAPARHVTWVALGAPWRSDAATCPECAALLRWTADRFDCPACGFAQPDATYRLDGDALRTPDGAVELGLALPGDWNRMNAALALTAAITHFGVDADSAVAGHARGRGGVGPVLRGAAPRRPRRAGAPRQESRRLDRGPALARATRVERGPRGERARGRRSRSVVAVGRAVRAAARQGRRRERRARPRRRGAARLRRRRPPRRAGSGGRGRGAARATCT